MRVMQSANYVGIDQRAAPRCDIYARVAVILPDGRSTMITMVNISADGVLIRHDQNLNDGDIVYFNMPVIGKVGGTCVWSVGGRSGIQFHLGIPSGDYDPMLRAMGGRIS